MAHIAAAPPGETSGSFNLNTISRGVSLADFYTAVPAAVVNFFEQDTNTRLIAQPQLRGQEGTELTLNLKWLLNGFIELRASSAWPPTMTLSPLWSITTSSRRPLLSRSFPAPPPSEARVGPDAHGGRRCGARSDPQPGFGRRIGRRSSESGAQQGRHLGQCRMPNRTVVARRSVVVHFPPYAS